MIDYHRCSIKYSIPALLRNPYVNLSGNGGSPSTDSCKFHNKPKTFGICGKVEYQSLRPADVHLELDIDLVQIDLIGASRGIVTTLRPNPALRLP